MSYLYLGIAIFAEIVATSLLKASEGFTRFVPTVILGVGYLVAFYCLSMALKEIPTGIAYAIWSGVGIVLVAVIAWIFQGQRLDLPAMIGMGLIIVGVLVMNLFSTTTGH
ncbi:MULTISPECIES: SMR family transporter [Gluconobacter]|uniref:Multidrug transporter n=4 Tax=Gluconobacter TaxID=441 RepID=A0A149TNV7_9PROT|nr:MULTISPECIES: SMR family transporter [Gluconobacter]KXV51409.1 multidrug transporter [Gluconobacter albidus]MBN3868542.1 EamA family transporter [Gluconobacter kondonii]MBS1026524.1 EamA family transporter [Gluconobacter cerinus]MBS1066909.1 EamA family transporter [Gluconobacter kondonii]GBR30010.1 quaternary ammonium compound resistance protein [Gluconobacter kondonii NBRC 3266]